MKTEIYYYNDDGGLATASKDCGKFTLEQMVAFQGWSWTKEAAYLIAVERVNRESMQIHERRDKLISSLICEVAQRKRKGTNV